MIIEVLITASTHGHMDDLSTMAYTLQNSLSDLDPPGAHASTPIAWCLHKDMDINSMIVLEQEFVLSFLTF